MGIMIIIHLNWGSILRDPNLMNHQSPRMSASSVEKNNLSMEVGLAPDKTSHGVLSIQANSWNIYRKPKFFFMNIMEMRWNESFQFLFNLMDLDDNTPWCPKAEATSPPAGRAMCWKSARPWGPQWGPSQISKLDIKAAGFRTGSLHWEDVVS